MASMQTRKVHNHSDEYVVFYDFADEQDELDAVAEPLEESDRTSRGE